MHIILMGPPAAGKGTQSKFLQEKYGLAHFSTGDELRSEIENVTDIGKKVEAIMKDGGLVSDDIIMDIIKDRLDNPDFAKGIIFDGVIRTIPQAEGLEKLLNERGEHIAIAFNLIVNEDMLLQRVETRVAQTIAAGQTPRKDDDPQVLKRRINEYKNFSKIVAPYYDDKGVLVEIDGEQPIENVTQMIESHMQSVSSHETKKEA